MKRFQALLILLLVFILPALAQEENVRKYYQAKLREANVHSQRGHFEHAMETYVQVLLEAPDTVPEVHFTCALNIAQVYLELGCWNQAEKHLNYAEKLRNNYNPTPTPVLLMSKGYLALEQGKTEEGIANLIRARDAAKAENNRKAYKTIFANLAHSLENLQRYDEALSMYKALADTVLAEGDSKMYFVALSGQGKVMLFLEDYAGAKVKLEQALELGTELQLDHRLVEVKGALAVLASSEANYEEAIKYMKSEKQDRDSLYGAATVDRIIRIEEEAGPNLYATRQEDTGPSNNWLVLTLLSLVVLAIPAIIVARKKLTQQAAPANEETISNSPTQVTKKTAEREITDELKQIWANLEELMNGQKLYLQPHLTIQEVAHVMGVSKNNLSKTINVLGNVNFKQYINLLRIQEAKSYLSDKQFLEQYTIENIALRCGFSNKVSFYSAFKKVNGQTPSEFIKSRS